MNVSLSSMYAPDNSQLTDKVLKHKFSLLAAKLFSRYHKLNKQIYIYFSATHKCVGRYFNYSMFNAIYFIANTINTFRVFHGQALTDLLIYA